MADVFTRLVGRTLGLAPILQPKPGSIYAPGQSIVNNFSALQPGEAGDVATQGLGNSETWDDRSGQGKKLQPLVASDRAMAITRLPSSLLSNFPSPEPVPRSSDHHSIDPVVSQEPSLVPEKVQSQSLEVSALDTNSDSNWDLVNNPEITSAQSPIISSAQPPTSNSVPIDFATAIPSSPSPSPQHSTPQYSANVNSDGLNQELPQLAALPDSTILVPQSTRAPSTIQPASLPIPARGSFITPAPDPDPSTELQPFVLTPPNPPVTKPTDPTTTPPLSQPLASQERRSTATHSELPPVNRPATPAARIAPLVSPASTPSGIQIEGRPTIAPVVQPDVRAMQPTPAPTIQVTIGRIEVRAVTPSAPPPPSRSVPSAPRLSLQDYLRARNGGNG